MLPLKVMKNPILSQRDLAFGRRMQRMRKKAGYTQEKLAEKIKVSLTFIGLIETGKRRPSMKTLQKIASALGVKEKDLL